MKKLFALLALFPFLPALAAEVAISGLPSASSVAGTDIAPISQGATTRKATMAQIATYVQTQTASIDLTSEVTGILPGANGGTGNGFAAFTGPATSLKTFTLPNASSTILTSNAAVTFGQGGTGLASAADDTLLLSTGSAWAAAAVPNCTDTGGNHLNYTAATNTISCGTSGDGTGSGGIAADPTASVGTTAVNGVATTYMRSDAAPAVSLSMTPSWTGVHTFTSTGQIVSSATGIGGDAAGIILRSTQPSLAFDESDAGTNAQKWNFRAQTRTFRIETLNNAQAGAKTAWVATRNTTASDITTVVYGNSTDLPTHTFHGNVIANQAIISAGTKFTATGCSNGTTVGGALAGQFASGTTGTCTVTITLPTSTNGWACQASDITTPANLISQSATTTTSCTITGTTVSGDTIVFSAMGY